MREAASNGNSGELVPTGRDEAGRFVRGNSYASGHQHPHARRSLWLRKIAVESVTEEEVKGIMAKLVEQALAGDVTSQREVLDRVCGKSGDVENLELLETLEVAIRDMRGGAAIIEASGGAQ